MEASYIGDANTWPECTVNNQYSSNNNSNKDGSNSDANTNSCDETSNDVTVADKTVSADGATAAITNNTLLDTTADLKKNLFTEEEFASLNHSEPIHIFLKIKPLSVAELLKQGNELLYKLQSETSISMRPPKNSVFAQNKQATQSLSKTIFQFSYIFQSTITQQEFFMGTIYPCFEKFFNGDNLLIFNYGVTNSGKTFTMQGTSVNPGLIPRTLDLLFDSLKEKLELKKSVYKFKPDKFNEISSLNETELKQELAQKEQLLRLSSYKETSLERVESCESLKDLSDDTTTTSSNTEYGSLQSSNKFGGSLDSLSSYTNDNLANFGDTADKIPKVRVPENKKYAIWISFFELYNDNIYDLLTIPDPKNKFQKTNCNNLNDRTSLRIREDMNKIPYVEGLTHVPVFSTNEAIRILKYGEKRLQKSNNSINSSSSRSHAVFCLKFVSIEKDPTGVSEHSTVCINQLSFCDLAGIERLSKTGAQGLTQKESSCINSSLSALSRCINQMIFNQKNVKTNHHQSSGQIPFRDNKLTRLFQAYFEGRGMVKMVVNLNPSLAGFDESVNVLKFASIANQIQLDLNDNDKIQYIYENEPPKNRSRETVAWETGAKAEETLNEDGEENEEGETQLEDSDEEDEEEDSTEVEETGSEESESNSEDEDDDDDDDGDEEEEDDEEEESGDEEEEEEEESSAEETLDETNDVTVEMKCKKPRFCLSSTKKPNKSTNSSYRKTPGKGILSKSIKKEPNKTPVVNQTIDSTNNQTNDNTEMESQSEEEDEETSEDETTNETTNVEKTNVEDGDSFETTANGTTLEETGITSNTTNFETTAAAESMEVDDEDEDNDDEEEETEDDDEEETEESSDEEEDCSEEESAQEQSGVNEEGEQSEEMEHTKEEEETNAGLTFNCTENMSSTMAANKTKKESLKGDGKNKKKSSLSKTTNESLILNGVVGTESAKKKEKNPKAKSICITSHTKKHSVLKTVDISLKTKEAKKLNKTVGFASDTKNISKVASSKFSRDMTKMSSQELIKRVEELESIVDQSKSDWIKYESDLRRELVTKWSKRVEDQDVFHQEEIKKQRIQVEDHWTKKMSMLEELCEIRMTTQLKDREKEHQLQLENLQEKMLQIELELKKSYEQLDCAKASLKTATDKNFFQIKSERISQSGFETHLRLDEKEDDPSRFEENRLSRLGEGEKESAPTYDKTIHNQADESNSNKRKLSLDSYEEDDYGIGKNSNMDYEEDNSSYGAEPNSGNYSKTSVGNKSKRRNTLANHSMQTEMVKGGNISIQTEIVQRRSIGIEASFDSEEIRSFKEQIQALSEQLQKSMEDIQKLRKENEILTEENKITTEQKKKLSDENSEITIELSKKIESNKYLQEEFDNHITIRKALEDELNTKINDLTKEVKSREAQLQKLAHDTDNECKTFKERMQKLSEEISQLNSELDEQSEDNKKYREKIIDFQKESKLINEKLINKDQEIIALNHVLEKKAIETNQNEQRIDQLKVELDEITSKYETSQEQVKSLKGQIDKMNKSLSQETQSHTDINIKYEAATKKIANLRTELENMQEQYDIILNENECLTSQLSKVQEDRDKICEEMKNQKKKFETEKKRLEQDRDEKEQTLKKQHDNEKKQYEREKEEREKLLKKQLENEKKQNEHDQEEREKALKKELEIQKKRNEKEREEKERFQKKLFDEEAKKAAMEQEQQEKDEKIHMSKPPKAVSRKKSDCDDLMQVEEREEVVTVKKLTKKSTSTAKMRQVSRSKLNSVDESEMEEAPKVAASSLAESSSSSNILKSSSSKSKLGKTKKQSSIKEVDNPEIEITKPLLSSVDQNSCILLDDSGTDIKKPTTKSGKTSTSSTAKSTTLTKEKEKPDASIKKKSTFSKLADIVTKSPIIEQFKRPQRQSKLKSSASNVSDLSDRTNLSTVSGIVSGSKSKAALSSLKNNQNDDDEDENLSPLVEEVKTRKVPIRKKK